MRAHSRGCEAAILPRARGHQIPAYRRVLPGPPILRAPTFLNRGWDPSWNFGILQSPVMGVDPDLGLHSH